MQCAQAELDSLRDAALPRPSRRYIRAFNMGSVPPADRTWNNTKRNDTQKFGTGWLLQVNQEGIKLGSGLHCLGVFPIPCVRV